MKALLLGYNRPIEVSRQIGFASEFEKFLMVIINRVVMSSNKLNAVIINAIKTNFDLI